MQKRGTEHYKFLRNLNSQAALEFLMTYGWAIMVVLVAIGALSYFGVLSPDKFIPRKCVLEPGIACTDFKVQEDSVTLVLRNGKGEDITMTSIKVGGCTGTTTGSLKNGEEATFRVGGCNNIASGKFNEEINITYISESGLSHKKRGNVADRVESGNAFTTSVVQLSPSADSYVRKDQPNANYGSDDEIKVYPWEVLSGFSHRGIIRFDLSSLPSGSTINSADMYLHESDTRGYDRTIAVHRLTSDWNENDITWNFAVLNFEPTPSTTSFVTWNYALGWESWDVTQDVQNFLDGSKTNFGWLMKDVNEDSSQDFWFFHSKESSQTARRPYLEVDYTSAAE